RAARPAAEADIPQRVERAQKVFQQKLWREQLRDWDETIKPASIKMHRDLQSIDPEKLSGDNLIMHLTRCRHHRGESIPQHALHGRSTSSDGRLPRARWRLDRPFAG